jgi:hypothetical protein
MEKATLRLVRAKAESFLAGVDPYFVFQLLVSMQQHSSIKTIRAKFFIKIDQTPLIHCASSIKSPWVKQPPTARDDSPESF